MRTTIIRSITTAGLLAVCAGPAAAQDRSVERQIEESAREFTRLIEQQARDFAAMMQQGRPRPPQPPPQPRRGQPRGPEQTERVVRTARLDGNGVLELSTRNGNVSVTGGSGNEVTIEAVKRTFGGRTQLQDVEIDVRQQGNRVEVGARYPDNRDENVAVDFNVTLPQSARVIVRTFSGNIRMANVRGEVRIDTFNGNIQSSGATGPGQLKTASGNINLIDVQTDDALSATSLNGNLTGQNVRGRSLSFITVSGNVRLTDIDCEETEVRSTNGDITYTGTLRRNGRFEATTHNGEITMVLGTSGFDLEASTLNGDIRSDFPVTFGGNGDGRRRPGAGDIIRGTVGGGGAVLELRSFNGNIAITRR